MCWCCTNRKCRAKLYTLGNPSVPIFSRLSGDHCHAAVEQRVLTRQKVSNAVKRKAVDNISEPGSKMIHRELKCQPEALDSISNMDIRYIRNSISRKKLYLGPKLPRSISELHTFLNAVEIKTVRGENFLVLNDNVNNVVIFSTKSNLEFMCAQENFYVDGTFDYAPKFFLQLFTIHAYGTNTYVPVVFCLITSKAEGTYYSMLRSVQQECEHHGYHWQPKFITIDFERAIHNSFRGVFPAVEIIGCRFHLAQSW